MGLSVRVMTSHSCTYTHSVSQLSGTTELKFTKVTRSQAGVYRVVIQSEVGRGVYSLSDTDEETSSQVDVTGEW